MSKVELGLFTDEEHEWAQNELKSTIIDTGTTDEELDALGQFYHDMIMEKRAMLPAPINTVAIDTLPENLEIVKFKGKDYVPTRNWPSTQKSINTMRWYRNTLLAAGAAIPILGEAVSYLTGADIRQISVIAGAAVAGGSLSGQFFMWVDNNSSMDLDMARITHADELQYSVKPVLQST